MFSENLSKTLFLYIQLHALKEVVVIMANSATILVPCRRHVVSTFICYLM